MSSLPIGQVCPLCGGLGREVGKKDDYPLRLCCGTLLSWTWDNEKAYQDFYVDIDAYHTSQQRKEGLLPIHDEKRDQDHVRAAQIRLMVMEGLIPEEATTLLDIGAGTGAFVREAKKEGYDAWGLEPCAKLVEWAQERNRNVEVGMWETVEGEWDVITMHDVLEHLTRPLNCLITLRRHLSPVGTLIVEMPEWDSTDQKLHGFEWRHVLPRQHICLYSRQSAESLFQRAGMEVYAFYRPLRGSLGKAAWFLKAIK
jgi:SAM-dependent methyltransferase